MEINGMHMDCIVITAMKRMFPNDDNWDIYCDVFNNKEDAYSFYHFCEESPLYKDVEMHFKNF